MSNVLRSLIVRIGADSTPAQKEFKKFSKELKASGKMLVETGKSLTMGLTLPIIGAAAAAIKYASDLEESTNKTDVAFKDSSTQVKAWAKTTLTSFGIAEGSALDAASTFGDMGTSMGLSTSKAADMSMKLTGLAGDLASFKNINIDQAMTALRGVFTGEGEALKTLGIVMQDNTLQAYALSKGYKTAYSEMSQAEKVALRYEYVMQATANAQGDFARTSDGAANQMRIAQEAMKQAAASIGTQLLPAFSRLLSGVNGVIKWFSELNDSTKESIVLVAGLVAGIGPMLVIIGKTKTALAGLMTIANNTALGFGKNGLAGALKGLTSTSGGTALAITGVALAVGGLSILFKNINKEGKELLSTSEDLAKSIGDARKEFDKAGAEISTNIKLTDDLTDELYRLDQKTGKTAAEQARMKSIVDQLNEIYPDLSLAIDKQTGKLSLTRTQLEKVTKAWADNAKAQAYSQALIKNEQARIDIMSQISKATKGAVGALDDLTAAQIEQMREQGKFKGLAMEQSLALRELIASLGYTEEQIESLKQGHAEYVTSVTDGNDALNQSNEETVTKQFEWASDMGSIYDKHIQMTKTTAEQVKKNLQQQIKEFENWRTNLKSLATKVPNDVLIELAKLGPGAAPLIADLTTKSQEELDKWVEVFKDAADNSTDSVVTELQDLPNAIVNDKEGGGTKGWKAAGEKLTRALGNGAYGASDYARRQAVLMALRIYNAIKGVFGIASPSKVGLALGKNVGRSIPDGIMSMASYAITKAQKFGDGITNALEMNPIDLEPLQPAKTARSNGSTASTEGEGEYYFEIPVTVDGREIARATAKFTAEELENLRKNKTVALGVT